MKKGILIFIVLAVLISKITIAQNYVQSVKGRVIDKTTQAPLAGANVIVPGTEPLKGTVTDADGYFLLTDIKTGRVNIQVSYMGYFPVALNNLILNTGKELILEIEMEEKVVAADDVVFVYKVDKTKALNDMATVSARTFTIEESEKYAGSFGDVARMASNYAGVQGLDDATNDIIIRGNSPNGLLWRLEGVDVPNPNHYGQFGATGGPISMLNNNVLSNSDFLTGAFPAEYGNALSGAFDLKMRNGNYDKHDFMGMIGMGGFEIGAEGPISKNSRSSYIINYRYSVMSLMTKIVDLGTGAAVPMYQDLTFKFNFPTKKMGTVSVFGLGGLSNINFKTSEQEENSDDNYYDYANFEYDAINDNAVGIIGIKDKYLINENSYIHLTLAATYQKNINDTDSLSSVDRNPVPWYRSELVDYKFNANLDYVKKINVKNNLKAGIRVSQINSNLSDSIWDATKGRFEVTGDYRGKTYLYQGYVQWQFKPTEKLTFNTGFNVPYLALNNEYQIEPRLAAKWSLNSKHAISIAYGLHSRMPNLAVTFRKVELNNGDIISPNTDLGFTKSHHYVVGYDWNIMKSTRIKLEAYYQKVFDAAVDQDSSSYSGLNDGSFSSFMSEYVKNGGTGKNIGAELTLERFIDKGLYYLLTVSVFDSKYKGSDGVERNTAFNSNYVCNALLGKEWEMGKKKNNLFGINTRFVYAGGKRYTPVDTEKSRIEGSTEYFEERAFSEQMKDFVRLDIRFSFKSNARKYTQEYALDIKNVTNRQNPMMMRYNTQTEELVTISQAGITPMLTYRIIF